MKRTSVLFLVPQKLFKITSLTLLDLSENDLSSLSSNIGNLVNLTEFNLSKNGKHLVGTRQPCSSIHFGLDGSVKPRVFILVDTLHSRRRSVSWPTNGQIAAKTSSDSSRLSKCRAPTLANNYTLGQRELYPKVFTTALLCSMSLFLCICHVIVIIRKIRLGRLHEAASMISTDGTNSVPIGRSVLDDSIQILHLMQCLHNSVQGSQIWHLIVGLAWAISYFVSSLTRTYS